MKQVINFLVCIKFSFSCIGCAAMLKCLSVFLPQRCKRFISTLFRKFYNRFLPEDNIKGTDIELNDVRNQLHIREHELSDLKNQNEQLVANNQALTEEILRLQSQNKTLEKEKQEALSRYVCYPKHDEDDTITTTTKNQQQQQQHLCKTNSYLIRVRKYEVYKKSTPRTQEQATF